MKSKNEEKSAEKKEEKKTTLKYKLEHINATAGLVKDAYDKLDSPLLLALDKGARKGWRVINVQILNGLSKGLEAYIIWEIDD